MKKLVIGLSGGMDSATLLGAALDKGFEVHCCTFEYGSKHNEFENDAAIAIVDYYKTKNYPVHQHFFDLTDVFSSFKSDLLLSGGEIPEGHYTGENMKSTVVPGRNLILASIMAGLAESIGADAIALGVHSGDHAIYPDCRPYFINMLASTLNGSTDGKVGILTPFIDMDKANILNIGYGLKPEVPYHLTRTCYKHQSVSCGKCGSCVERILAYDSIGRKDEITYDLPWEEVIHNAKNLKVNE